MSIAFLSAGLQLFGQDTIMLKKKILGLPYSKKTYENINFNSDWLMKNVGKKSNITVHELYEGEPNGLVFQYKRKVSRIEYFYNDTNEMFRKKYFKSKEIYSTYFKKGIYNGIGIGHYVKPRKEYWEKLGSSFCYRGYVVNGKLDGLYVKYIETTWWDRSTVNNNSFYYQVDSYKGNGKSFYYIFECWPSKSPDSSLQYTPIRLRRNNEFDSLFSIYGIDTNLIIKHFKIQDTMFARLRRKVESEIIGKYGKPIISHLEVEKYLNWRFGIKKSEND